MADTTQQEDPIYAALLTLRDESVDHHKNVKHLQTSKQLEGPVLADAVVDTSSLLSDLATRLAELLAPMDEAEAEAEDEDDEEVAMGLSAEEATLFRTLLVGYGEVVQSILSQLPAEDPQAKALAETKSQIAQAQEIVNELELEEIDEDGEEGGDDDEPEAEAAGD